MLTAKEVHIKASPERVVEEMKAAIDMPVVTVDPNHGIGHYEDHVGWQFIGHVSSDGFKVIRRYRQGYRPSQMLSNWNSANYGGLYGPTLQGRIQPVGAGTLLVYEFTRNPSFWMFSILIGILGSIASGVIALLGFSQGNLSLESFMIPAYVVSMFLIGNASMALLAEARERSALKDWINGIKAKAEKVQ